MSNTSSPDWTRLLLVLFVGLLIVDLGWTAAVNNRTAAVEDRVDRIDRDQGTLATYYGLNESVGGRTDAAVRLYAYEKATGDAVAVDARVVAVPADGLYLNVRELSLTAALQRAAKRAWTAASESAPEPAHRGAVVTIDAPSSWDTVGGGSAAVSLATGFAATNPCASVNRSVAATGGLTEAGRLVRVDAVEAKARAAQRRGADVFVVPSGQGVDVDGITVVEATTFGEAAEHTLDVRASCPDDGRPSG